MNKIKKVMVIGVFALVLMGVAATPASAKAKKSSKPIDISKYVVRDKWNFYLKKNKKIKFKKIGKKDPLFRKYSKNKYVFNEDRSAIKKCKVKTKITGFNGTKTVKGIIGKYVCGFYNSYDENYGKTKYYYTFIYKGKKYCFKKTSSNYKNKIKTLMLRLAFYDQNEKSIDSWMSHYLNLTENAYNFATSKFSVLVDEDDMDYASDYIVDCKVNFNLNNPNLIDYNTFKISDKYSEYHDYFEKNNIHSNSDLYNFVMLV